MTRIHTQAEWVERAREVLPGAGFGNFDPSVVIREGRGSRVWDEDGKEYIDGLIGSGPMLLGHGHPEVMEAVLSQLPRGMTFFANNAAGIDLAEQIVASVACAEQVRYVASGGEADMYAMRLARAYTGRNLILKFEGGYHGMSAEAQMSLAPTRYGNFPKAEPDSAGIPQAVADNMLIAPFNDEQFLQSLFAEYGKDIAAVIVEPLQRVIPPQPGFLAALRTLCDAAGALLIFDEIVTGYRLAYGGAQEFYGVTPDLCTLGKIVGGGFALAAIAGPRKIMRHFDKADVGASGWLMQLGTLSGSPVAAVAGLKTMEVLRREGAYARLRNNGARMMASYRHHLDRAGVKYRIVGEETLFDVVFTDHEIRNYRDMRDVDTAAASRLNAAMRRGGVLKSPSKLYPSLALDEKDLAEFDAIVGAAVDEVFA
ncbi:MAG: aspartate aminotransferase family protein [Mesorhizobium sp. 61-13]|nr:MAG: aspartate aminotransferase family protein [Mesorhizobium sp. 61-13]